MDMKKKFFAIIIEIIIIGFCYFDFQDGLYGGFSLLYKSKLPIEAKPSLSTHSYPAAFHFKYDGDRCSKLFFMKGFSVYPDTFNLDFIAYGYNDTSIIVLLK